MTGAHPEVPDARQAHPNQRPAPGFHHEAVLYRGGEEFLAAVLPFVREAIILGHPILVAVPEPRGSLLRSAVGASEIVRFVDMERVGRNPGRIIPLWVEFVAEAGRPDHPVKGIGEAIWAARTTDELVECHRHEALVNLAFAEATSFSLLCPYDTVSQPNDVVAAAERTHPHVRGEDGTRRAGRYTSVAEALAHYDDALTAAPDDARSLVVDVNTLRTLRRQVVELLNGAGVDDHRHDEVLVAVNEVATNSIRHGGGTGLVRFWSEADAVVFDVVDRGHLDQPLAGRLRPAPGSTSGWGLWLAHQYSDLLHVRTNAAGTNVRLRVRTDGLAGPQPAVRSSQ